MARFHLYPVPDAYRILRSVTIVSDQDYPAGSSSYIFKAGVASTRGVDYYGIQFDGSTRKITANDPLSLLSDGDVQLGEGESVVLDVTANGLPADLGGTSVFVEIDNSLKDPGHRVKEPEVQAAVDGLADHLRSIRAGIKTVVVALPRQIDDVGVGGAYHEETASAEVVTSGTFVASTVLTTITVAGSPFRPSAVEVVATATHEGTIGTDILWIAVSNDGGTTTYAPNGQYARVEGLASVTTHYAETITQDVTYTLMLRQAGGNPNVTNQAMSVLVSEA